MDQKAGLSQGTRSVFQVFTLTVTLLLAGWWMSSQPVHLATQPIENFQTRTIQPQATFLVANTGDNGGVNPAPGDGTGTLRQAIIDANANPGADLIDATGITGTIGLQAALPTISQPLTINGPNSGTLTVTRAVGASFGIFTVGSNASTTLNRLVMTNGSAAQGAGINSGPGSDLTLSQCTLAGHVGSSFHGALQFAGGAGRTLTIDSCTIASNTSMGAAIGTNDAGGEIVMLRNSTFQNNVSTAFNGGAYDPGPNLTLTIANCTFSGNSSVARGGAIRFQSTYSGTATVANCTFTGNRGNLSGGGISRAGTGSVTLINTLAAGNFTNAAPSTTPDDIEGVSFAATSANNLVGVNTGLAGITNGNNGNLVGTAASPINPLLGPLAGNGGLTQTHALLAGSPAIHAGTASGAPATDQRGVIRDANPDIGAFEATVVTIFRALASPQCPNGQVTWTVGFQSPTAGLTMANLSLAAGGGLGGTPTLLNVTPNTTPPTRSWTVTATAGNGEGTLGLNLVNSGGLTPVPGDVLPVTGQVYTFASGTTVSPASLPNGAVGTAYSQTITATGGSGATFSFAHTAGALPSGVTLSPTGVLAGNPTVSGTYTFTITATSGGCVGSRGYTVTIARQVNSSVSVLVTGTSSNMTPSTGFIGDFTVDTELQNTSGGTLNGPLYFQVTRLQPVGETHVYRLKTADDFVAGGPTGGLVGSRQTVAAGSLASGGTMPVSFTVGIATARVQFQFQVDLYAVNGTSPTGNRLGSYSFTINHSFGSGGKGGFTGTKLEVEPAAGTETPLIAGVGKQSSPVLAIAPNHPNRWAVAADDYLTRTIVVRTTETGGASWREHRLSRVLNGQEFHVANTPTLAFTPQGDLVVAYVLGNLENSANALVVSRLGDRLTFSSPLSVGSYLSGERKFVARPYLAVNDAGTGYLAWETVDTANETSTITVGRVAGSTGLQTTVAQGKVAGPTLAFGPKGTLYVGWHEWSTKANDRGGEVRLAVSQSDLNFGPAQSVAATGIGFGRTIAAMPEEEVTPNLALLADPLQSGRLYAVFTAAGDGLDVKLARSENDGQSWSLPQLVSDVTAGDQFHPAAAIDGKGNLSVSYYDTRHSLGNETVLVRLGKSGDGLSFTHSQVSTVPSNDSRSNPRRDTTSNLGTRLGLKTSNGIPVMVWTDTRNGSEDVFLTTAK